MFLPLSSPTFNIQASIEIGNILEIMDLLHLHNQGWLLEILFFASFPSIIYFFSENIAS